jgi:hypothetical protein
MEGHNSFLKQQSSLVKQANFCPSVRPGNSAGALSFLLPENSRKSVNSKGDNSLFETAVFLTSQFLPQREAGDSGGTLSFLPAPFLFSFQKLWFSKITIPFLSKQFCKGFSIKCPFIFL